MTSLSKAIINTRQDLDALIGAQEHYEFMQKLKGSMLHTKLLLRSKSLTKRTRRLLVQNYLGSQRKNLR